MPHTPHRLLVVLFVFSLSPGMVLGGEAWLQWQYDERHSGDVATRDVAPPLALVGTVALTDSVLAAPAIADDRLYVVDASGVLSCIDATSLSIVWQFRAAGGAANCSNVSAPAIVGPYVHFATVTGRYYVLDRQSGAVVREIAAGDPIFSAPVCANGRAYFVTVGARVYAVEPDGQMAWTWDFVRDVIGFVGDRWSGAVWQEHKNADGGQTGDPRSGGAAGPETHAERGGPRNRVTWRDHFCCSRDLAVFGRTLVIPAGGRTVFLEDAGGQAKLVAIGQIPDYAGQEYAACFGQSIGPEGEVYVQWHRRDNAGRVEILRLLGDKVQTDFVAGTQTAIHLPGLLSFSPVAVRGRDVYRCRPEEGFGFCRHSPGESSPVCLGGYPSIAPPVLLGKHGLVSGLDGSLHVVPLDGGGSSWSFRTAFGRAISSPAIVCDGRVYFGCEDGYLYVLGPEGAGELPQRRLGLEQIRSPLGGPYRGAEYDWSTNYGNAAGTNANDQGIQPPLKIKWMRRYDGTFKHLPICGGGRMYTHTSEGQIFAVEQETGRLLWRRYWPGVFLSFTSPLYFRTQAGERLLVPQAGLGESRMRCLDAATGELLWESPFTGSPSWSRQAPPVIVGELAIYASGSGRYAPQGTERAFVMKGEPVASSDGSEVMSFIYTHDNPYYPRDNRPLIWAWDAQTGRLVWQRDFSQYGSGGNDCGLCVLDGQLYYSTFFGYSADRRRRRGQTGIANGLTASLDPATGATRWLTTEHYVTAGCTISGGEGRLYVGGYNPPHEATSDRYVFCLDARDGSLVWRSDPVRSAVNVVSVSRDFLFSNASGHDGHVIDKATGKIVSRFNFGYACTRFTCSGNYVLGANMDMIDLAQDNRLVSTGPCIDSRECVGSTVSNGRVFYTSQASGLQVSLAAGEEARQLRSPWELEGRATSPTAGGGAHEGDASK